MKNILLLFLCLFTGIQINAQCKPDCESSTEQATCCPKTECCPASRPGGVGPIGLMGDHYHHQGGLMLSYRYMNMSMEGNRSGTNTIDDNTVLQNYLMAPQEMTMHMHMLGAMFGVTDRITLMGMINYLDNEMSMVAIDGTQHFHSSKGYGDVKLSAIAGLWELGTRSFHLNAGLSIPTGDIDQDEMHLHGTHEMMMNLPYPMQLGTGTVDLSFGGTYLTQWKNFAFGIQPLMTFRTGENHNEYRLGNDYQLNSWLIYQLNDWVNCALRVKGKAIGEIRGEDLEMNSEMAPTSDPINSGGEFINAFGGINITVPEGSFQGLNLGFEFGVPVYQNPNGIQMTQHTVLTAGLRYSLF